MQKYEEIKSNGVTSILNVDYELDLIDVDPDEFLYAKIGLKNTSDNPDFMKSLAIVSLSTFVENGRKVLVVSEFGLSRPPYIVFRYLAEKENRSIESLYQEFQHLGFKISPLNNHV